MSRRPWFGLLPSPMMRAHEAFARELETHEAPTDDMEAEICVCVSRLAGTMNQSSWLMGGGRMLVEVDDSGFGCSWLKSSHVVIRPS